MDCIHCFSSIANAFSSFAEDTADTAVMAHTMRITSNLVAGVESGYYFDVAVDATVEILREKIGAKRIIPLAQVVLLYEGQELVDG